MTTAQRMLVLMHVVVFLGIATVSGFDGIDLQFITQRWTPDGAVSGSSGAGAATSGMVSTVHLNPALVSAWHSQAKKNFGLQWMYANDSLFSRYAVSGGLSWYVNEKNTIGMLFRSMRKSHSNSHDEFTFNLGGTMFPKDGDHGAVTMGLNMRLERLSWNQLQPESLTVKQYRFGPGGVVLTDAPTIRKYHQPFAMQPLLEEKRFITDLGFFQADASQNIDFGLVIHDLWGYVWSRRNPFITSRTDTIFDSLAIPRYQIDSSYYDYRTTRSRGVNDAIYRRMTIGITYRFPLADNNDENVVMIPFDCEFFGTFTKKYPTKIAIHTGLALWLYDNTVGARFGYAYAPTPVTRENGVLRFQNQSRYSGGMSVHFSTVWLSAYWQDELWGLDIATALSKTSKKKKKPKGYFNTGEDSE